MEAATGRITIDSTVVYDIVHERRPRHELAVKLLELARGGEVDIAIAGSGWSYDFTKPKRDLANEMLGHLEGAATMTPQLSYVGPHTYPSSTLWPGAYVEGFSEAWGAELREWPPGTKRPGDADRLHVETHLLHRRDVFITNDEPLLKMCARLAAGWEIDAVGLADYFERRCDRT